MAQQKQGGSPRLSIMDKLRFEEERLDTNIRRMFGLSIYLVALQLGLNVLNILIPQRTGDGMPVPLDIYIGLSLFTLGVGLIFWLIFGLARIGRIKSRRFLRRAVQFILYFYLVIQLGFCTINILSNQGVNSFIMLLVVFSMIPILPRRQSIITISFAFLYVMGVLVLTQDMTGSTVLSDGTTAYWTISSLSDFLYSDMRANLIILTVMSIFVSVIVYNLYLSNFIKNLELEKRSETFEQMVFLRTKELAEQTEAAQAAERAKTQFLANMSHEIRTPLNAVMGMAHIARNTTDPVKSAAALDQVGASASQLLNLLNDVLDMSNIESGTLSIENGRFLLGKCLQEVAASIEIRCIAKHQTFETNVADLPDVMVIGDKLRLKQVLFNLLDNAVKYTPERGSIAFGALLSSGFSAGVPHKANVADAVTLRVTVADNGRGVDEATRAKLYEPFERSEAIGSKKAGFGLGLPIAQALVGMMGGRIELSRAPGWTSVFRFALMLEKAPVEEVSQGGLDFAGKRLLCVEDIEVNRLIVREMLSDTALTVEEAADGVIALEMFQASPEGYYDYIFMDLLMPRMDGFEATRRIRALERADAKTVPIVALSANSSRNDLEQSKAVGMNEHLVKPIHYEAIIRVLSSF